jgi:TolB-like protein
LVQGVAGVALSLAMLAGFAWWQPWAPEFEPVDPATMVQPLPAKPSIAVLALDDLSSGDDKDYLSDAIAEGIITELSRFTEFFVIARNSSFAYRDTATDVRTIAKELGVHYIDEGSLQKAGEKLRVTVQLVDALAGNHIWAETYDRDLADLFAVQDEIVREIASAIGGKVAFQPPPSGGLDKVSALHLNLQGRPFVRQWSKEGTHKALELNLAAVDADPESPFGYIGLAFIYPRAEYGWLGMDGEKGLRKAEEAADQALALDPDNYDAHFARAFVLSRRGEHDRAIERYSRALELIPSAATRRWT